MILKPFTYHAPTHVDDAVKLISTLDRARICAGGTFLINNLKLIKKNLKQGPSHVISLKKIDALKGITFDGKVLSIGAMTNMQEIVDSSIISEHFPILKQLAINIGSTTIRHMATVGGNIASRVVWTEWPVVLLALDAKCLFESTQKGQETILMEDFYKTTVKTKGLLTKIIIEKNTQRHINYQRVARSTTLDLPLLGVCVETTIQNKKLTNTRVCINSTTQYALRDNSCEEFLNNASLNSSIAEDALAHLDKSLVPFDNDYKQHMFELSIKNAINTIIKEI